MNVFMIILTIVFASLSIFLISKYGVKKKEENEFIDSNKQE